MNSPIVPVVVVSQDGPNPLGIARALGRVGIPVFLFSTGKTRLLKCSRYIKSIVENPSLGNLEGTREHFENILEKILHLGYTSRPILMFTNEAHYQSFYPLKDYLNDRFLLMTPFEKVISLTEKHQQFPYAEQAGFRNLPLMVLKSPKDLDTLESSLCFPVIVRPNSLQTKGGFNEKTSLYENLSQMKSHLFPILSQEGVELLAQEYVPGSDKDVLVFMASCGDEGEPRAWVSGRKWRQIPPGRGLMASGVAENIPEFVEKSKELCRLLGVRGFVGIECKRNTVTNELVYIEASLRTDAFNGLCLAAGMNLVLDAYMARLGQPCGITQKQSFAGSWVCFQYDLDAAKTMIFQKQLTWSSFLRPLPRPIYYAYFAWDDPLPFVFHFSKTIAQKIFCWFK